MARTQFVMDPSWERTVNALSEPALDSAADIVADGQRRRIPVSRDGSHGRVPGFARSQIHVERGRDPFGPYRDVGTGDRALSPTGYNYPLGLELGTPPHDIRSHGDYPLRDRRGNVFGREVHHPGTRPYPWLRAGMQDLAGRTL